jgi:hypothetical protein
MYALGFFEGVIDRLGALVRDLFSMAGSLFFASDGTFTAILLPILLLGLLVLGLHWWRVS